MLENADTVAMVDPQVALKAVEAGADAVELNVSCPHVKDTGHEIGQHSKTLAEVVEKVKASVKKPVIVKLSPNVTDIVEIARTAVRAGAEGLTAVNTVKAWQSTSKHKCQIRCLKYGLRRLAKIEKTIEERLTRQAKRYNKLYPGQMIHGDTKRLPLLTNQKTTDTREYLFVALFFAKEISLPPQYGALTMGYLSRRD
jgi:hypothetical protein